MFCLLFGPGHVLFFAVFAGDRSSLTYRPAWLGFKGHINKKDQTAKKTQIPCGCMYINISTYTKFASPEMTSPLNT